MKQIKIIGTGVLDIKEIDKLKEFPQEYGIQRMTDRNNIDRIVKSMEELYIPSVIRVNQDWFILDGQHSKEAIKKIALKEGQVAYVMYDTEGRDKDVCVLLNTTSKKWEAKDFLNVWVNSGKDDYIFFKYIWDTYNLNYQSVMCLVTGITQGSSSKEALIFKNGDMKIPQERRNKCIEIGRQLNDVKMYVPKKIGSQRNFHLAFIKIALNENYNHERMINKLEYQGDKIYKCTSKNGYIEMLESIYNYKSKNKVLF